MKGKQVWQYQGDMRCPICGRYSQVHMKGKKDPTYRLNCKAHGIFYKTGMSHWSQEDSHENELKELANKLMRGEVAVCQH